MVLYKNGEIYGAGRNDDGQLGELDMEAEEMGTFRKLKHIKDVKRIFCSSHFNYALNDENQMYAWGQGDGYVLGNGKEDSLTVAR